MTFAKKHTQPPKPVPNPHDAFARSVFREIDHARGLFRGYLPPPLARHFNWGTLRLESDSFLGDDLQEEFADLCFSACFLGDSLRRRLRFQFEHKRDVNYQTPRQLFGYVAQQFAETPTDQSLPCIVNVVLLQGETWRRTPTLSSLYDLPEAVRADVLPYLLDFQMVMIELDSLPPSDLKGTVVGRLALALLQAVGHGEPMGWTRNEPLLQDVMRNLPEDELKRELRRAVYYLSNVTEPGMQPSVRETVLDLREEYRPVKEEMMTLLEHLERRGERRGRRQGERRGELNLLLRLLAQVNVKLSAAETRKLLRVSPAQFKRFEDAVVARQPPKEIRSLVAELTQ